MTRLILSLTLLLFVLPVGQEAEAQNRGSSLPGLSAQDVEEMGAEAEVFLGTLRAIRDFALTSEPDSVLWEKAIRGLIKELDDPYADVLTPDQVRAFEEESTGNYAGIGVQITELNEAVTITAVFRNTPADQEGLLVGDRIVAVNGDDARGWSVTEASNRIRGEIGSEVEVEVERDGIEQPIPHRIRRDQVHIPAVTSERIFGDVGYVLLDRVARESAAEVDSVLTELDGVTGLILDLRRNPGGYLDESLNLADLFLDRGSTLVTTRSRTPGGNGQVREESAYARRAARAPNTPLIVLVDRFSASASEIVAGALQDHDRALVIGERTFGKGSVQSVVPLPAEHMIRLTSGEWYTPLGRSLNRPRDREGRVIEPDSIPRFTSEGGRTIWGGGGVFPDVEVRGDTLSSEEQDLLNGSVDAGIPLTQRIQEAAFAVAQEVRDGEIPEAFPQGVAESFIAGLVEDGLDDALLTQNTREYLHWQLERTMYQRLDLVAQSLQTQARRDPVLAKAIELLGQAGNQDELFALVPEAERPSVESQARRQAGDPSSPE
jgi:carboxyl-terminal processing protease